MEADNLLEFVALYDIDGNQVGSIERAKAHTSKEYLHGAVHIFVFNSRKELLLQKRAKTKLIAPGKYDISAGGHIGFGEEESNAAKRELEEELGIKNVDLRFLYKYVWESFIERELVFSYYTIWDGKIDYLKSEIDEVRFFKISEINRDEIFSSNLLYEIEKLKGFDIKL